MKSRLIFLYVYIFFCSENTPPLPPPKKIHSRKMPFRREEVSLFVGIKILVNFAPKRKAKI